jgi:hypothetical protein
MWLNFRIGINYLLLCSNLCLTSMFLKYPKHETSPSISVLNEDTRDSAPEIKPTYLIRIR